MNYEINKNMRFGLVGGSAVLLFCGSGAACISNSKVNKANNKVVILLFQGVRATWSILEANTRQSGEGNCCAGVKTLSNTRTRTSTS